MLSRKSLMIALLGASLVGSQAHAQGWFQNFTANVEQYGASVTAAITNGAALFTAGKIAEPFFKWNGKKAPGRLGTIFRGLSFSTILGCVSLNLWNDPQLTSFLHRSSKQLITKTSETVAKVIT